MTKTKRHDPITTNFCGYDFQSVRVDDVDYYPIALLPKDSTGESGFPVRQNEASTDLKRILGNDFPSAKISTTLNSRKVNCLSEETLIDLIDACT